MKERAPIRNEVESWYQQYGAALLVFGIVVAGDRGRAQDALHQVFLRLLEHRGLDQITDIRSYLFTALRNTIMNDARHRRRVAPLEDDDTPWLESPDRDYLEERRVRRALADLPEDQRQIMVLHIWGGLTFAQAAEVVGINANTAAARYRYGLAKLRDSLTTERGQQANARSDR